VAQQEKGSGSLDDDASLKYRQVEKHLRVAKKMAPSMTTLLRMESVLGSRHALGTLHALEMIAAMTAVENRATSEKLLKWVAEGIFVSILRGTAPRDAKGVELKALAHEWLLIRRVVLYLGKKVSAAPDPSVVYLDRCCPTVAIKNMFETPLGFHKSMPRGTQLPPDFAGSVAFMPPCYGAQFPQVLVDTIDFVAALCDRRPDAHDACQRGMAKNVFVSAETFLAELDKELFDAAGIFEELECAALAARRELDATALRARQEDAAAAALIVVEKPAAPEVADDDELMEDPPSLSVPEPEPETERNVARHFKYLHLAALMVDRFDAVAPHAFDALVAAADARVHAVAHFAMQPGVRSCCSRRLLR
jgi:hypothetical protein